MQKRLRGSKRAILKKVTAVNLFADQATQIQAIMEATGAQEVAPVVRLLLDEAFGARRRKSVHVEEPEPAANESTRRTRNNPDPPAENDSAGREHLPNAKCEFGASTGGSSRSPRRKE